MARNTRSTKKASDDDDSKNASSTRTPRRVSRRESATRQNGRKHQNGKAESDTEDVDEDSDAYVQDDDDDEVSLNSDTLDDPDFDASGKKRKRASGSKNASPKKSRSSTKSPVKKKRAPVSDDEEEELEDGQEIVGTVVQAPKTGRVPPGQISRNTFNFLKQLQDPECNDRTWFKLHEPVYRLAEKEWKDFIDEFTLLLTEADPQIPPLPPNDVVHRIYRDIRFSNDKTPYKTNLSASFSRSGRKGIFAGCQSPVRDFIKSFAGCTDMKIKSTLKEASNPAEVYLLQELGVPEGMKCRLSVISDPAFVELFGEPKPHPKGERRNIFGMEDELKVAPKGIDKTHTDIDLLKCRSFAVVHKFTDKEVLDADFKEEVKRIVTITRPFVHCLNDLMTIPPDEDESGSGSDNGEDD